MVEQLTADQQVIGSNPMVDLLPGLQLVLCRFGLARTDNGNGYGYGHGKTDLMRMHVTITVIDRTARHIVSSNTSCCTLIWVY